MPVDKYYTLLESPVGHVALGPINIEEVGESNTDGKVIAASNVLKATNGHTYFWVFQYDEGVKDFEDDFKSLLVNFRLTGVDEPLVIDEIKPVFDSSVYRKICETESSDVEVRVCDNYYSTYPSGYYSVQNYREAQAGGGFKAIVVDADTKIYDSQGNFVISCGGFKGYSSEEARLLEEKECAKYHFSNCTVKKSCFELSDF